MIIIKPTMPAANNNVDVIMMFYINVLIIFIKCLPHLTICKKDQQSSAFPERILLQILCEECFWILLKQKTLH